MLLREISSLTLVKASNSRGFYFDKTGHPGRYEPLFTGSLSAAKKFVKKYISGIEGATAIKGQVEDGNPHVWDVYVGDKFNRRVEIEDTK